MKNNAAKTNIVLIGMPGAGKSTIGVVLAKVLAMDFVDSDLVIQKEEGRRLSEIIEEEGPRGFLRIEERVNASLECTNCVIATGGSAVYGGRAMEHLRRSGAVIYLRLSYPSLEGRLHNLKGRGVVMNPGQTLRGIYDERIVLYEKYADITVDADGLSVEETLQKTLEAVEGLYKA